jgi:hypothetical protein
VGNKNGDLALMFDPLEEASVAYSRAVPDKRGYGKVVIAVSA